MKKILFVVNAIEYFATHRLPIAQKAYELGYNVHIASTFMSYEGMAEVEKITNYGFEFHHIPISRGGQNPLVELYALIKIHLLIRKLSPDIVHLVTLKPVLYGGIAARINGVKSVVAAVAGLGSVFLANSATAKLRKWIVTRMYCAAFKQKQLAVIFQNSDDLDTLLALGVLHASQARIIRGSGVALGDYPYLPEPQGKPVVVMATRLLKDKGVFEYAEAARLLRQRCVDLEMRLIGSPDPGNPTSVTQHELDNWAQERCVVLMGFRTDIATQYAAANVICLPSYREGLPKSLIEAAACGRAVVTTDVPGCRDAITPDVTGLLVPVKNAVALADAIQKLIDEPELRKRMGKAGRSLAEREFAIEKIVEQHLKIYREMERDSTEKHNT